ncbi:MAG: hypothetical protein KA369_22755 [Spirochaetes bacterium]|nr:hypothetical protein [Spirochaetota bacterium]
MKYFGEKSLSSFFSGFLKVCWYVVLVGSIIGAVAGIVFILYSSLGDKFGMGIPQCAPNDLGMDPKEKQDWETFKNLPIAIKFIILPYCAVVVVFLLKIIKKSQEVFTNFKNDIVFNRSNVLLISKISKLLIVFSIITFSFNSLLVSVLLLVFCEVVKSGTALQEEHDLTV